MIEITFDDIPELPNWLLDAEAQEGHDYELDALNEEEWWNNKGE